MHGVKRKEVVDHNLNELQKEALAEEETKISEYQQIIGKVLSYQPTSPDFAGKEEEALEHLNKLLIINPDFLSAWNIRKQVLNLFLEGPKKDDLAKVLINEFKFGVDVIKLNPKSYGSWYHRKWLITQMSKLNLPFDAKREMSLCDQLLQLDSRNFHCWNYRWYLFTLYSGSFTIQSEFDFTTLMIYQNFSNYSAWHRRTLLLPRMPAEEISSIIQSDLKLIKSAYFTEPADQSCWYYLVWLLDFYTTRIDSMEERIQVVKGELANIEELLCLEPSASLALNAWIQIVLKWKLEHEYRERLIEHLKTLVNCDPQRRGMYEEMLAKLV